MKNRTSGFTLVELMVVVLVVALLVLVSTQIPLFSLGSWRKGADRLKMQRDAHYAMLRIQRKLRSASSPNVYVSPEDASTLVIDGENFVLEGDYDPQFTVTSGDGTINITLTLVKENVGTIILRTAVKPRN